MPSFESLNIFSQVNFIVQYITIFINTAGIVGNLLLIGVLSRTSFRKHSYSFFSIAKAVVDTIVIAHAYRNWLRFNYDTNLDTVNSFFCLFINRFFVYTNLFIGVMLLPLISFDRLVIIVYPNRFQFVKKKWFQWLAILFSIVYSILFNIILLFNTQLITRPDGVRVCLIEFAEFSKHSWMMVGNIVGFVLIINTAINVKLIRHIVASRRKVASSASNAKRTTRKDRKFAITSIGLGLMAFFFKIPTAIVIIVSTSLNIGIDLYSMMFAIGITLLGIDCGSAFYLNMLLNPMFSDEFKKMLPWKKKVTNAAVAGESQTAASTK